MDKIYLYEKLINKNDYNYKIYLDKKEDIPAKKEDVLKYFKERFKAREVCKVNQVEDDNIFDLGFKYTKEENTYKNLVVDDVDILDELLTCKEKEQFLKVEYKEYKYQKLKEACYYDEDEEIDWDYEDDEDSEEIYQSWYYGGQYWDDWREKEDELNEIDIYNETEYKYGQYTHNGKPGVKMSDFEKVQNERFLRNGIWVESRDIPYNYVENYRIYIILESLDNEYITNINYISRKCYKIENHLKAIRNYSRIFSENVKIENIDGKNRLVFQCNDSNQEDITKEVKNDLYIFAKSGLLGKELENNCKKSRVIKTVQNIDFELYEDKSINLTAKRLIDMYEKDQKNSDRNLLYPLDDYIIEDESMNHDNLTN
ncbi:hypothetical protein [Terrisporobacter mayombei]|uniref:GIY-YIG domain-containing protein n=1 Tax=Terrisporobacter mayombei TaxID=1541 RepID=A0ABY9Q4C3_9FIRM|nr:hypothetical protein [Terrisporobacter mayombei]MCC3870112.1 hypothetical protein [Terrisporobacter mayombei]WMT82348.1 hypothetical protein TEMA_27190 [Terrisporobacter mayombei]